jgi:hypothetical protein
MGNTHSSLGTIFGSVAGGLLLAPFTGGASLVAVGVASGVGTAVGATTFTYNAINNRNPKEGKETTDLLIGIGCGAIGPACGYASSLGAEVSVGVDFLGSGLGLGATNAGDGKFKPYAGNQKEAVKHYTQKEENKKISEVSQQVPVAKEFFKNPIILEYENIKLPDVNIRYFHKGQVNRYVNLTYATLSLSNLPKSNLVKYYEDCEKKGNAYASKSKQYLLEAIVYGLNALENAKTFTSEQEMMTRTTDIQKIDEDMRTFGSLMVKSFKSMVQSVKEETRLAREQTKIKENVDKAWDIKSSHEKRHQSIYFDAEKYKLTTTEKIKKIEDFLDKLDGKKIEEKDIIQQIYWTLK